MSSQKPGNIFAIGRFASPIGAIFVASCRGGLKEICVGVRKAEFVAEIKRKYGARIVEKKGGFARLFKLLNSYFKGKKVSFDLWLDPEGTEFEIKVWAALSRIPYGETKTYSDVAREIGSNNGARAVGGACGKNPLPIIVPCHRVVGTNGLGGYSAGGVETKVTPFYKGGLGGIKEFLLRLEGAPAPLS
ncbi:MAG: methylated-DNA--[protein]-cysteine S-methyltransferase [Thermodesulfobacteriota bacterium]